MEQMDKLNQKFGWRTIHFAGMGIEWQMKQQYLFKRYTTRWSELMEVAAE